MTISIPRIGRPALTAIALGLIVLASTASTALAALDSVPDTTYQTNGRVHSIIRVNGVVYVGGAFTSVRPAGDPEGTGEVPRSNVFAFNAHTGALLPWDPSPNGTVRALAAGPTGNTIFMGGTFSTVGGHAHASLAAVAACTNFATCPGTVLSWGAHTNGDVFSLMAAGTKLYVGGNFGQVNGIAKKNLAAVGISSGHLLKWGAGADNEVRALLITPNGQRVMVGGYFTHIGSLAQDHLSALSAANGVVLPWKSHPVFAVLALAETSSYLFAGGSGGGGHMPSYLLSGGKLRWQAGANGDITGVSMYHGEIFAAGHYNQFGAQTRLHLALINDISGKVDLTWHPSANSVLGTFVALAYGQQIYTGGDFTRIGGVDQEGLAAFSDTVTDSTPPTISKVPNVAMVPGTTIGSFIPVTLSWAGHDDLAGVCRYSLQEAINSGAFANAVPPFPTATSMARALRPNFSYHFKAFDTDCSDNVGSTVSGPTDRIGIFQNSSPSIAYAGSWTRGAHVSGASGGTVNLTTQAGASATLHFTGRQVAWVGSKSATRGRASVYIDGHLVRTVDLHSTATHRRQIVFVRTFSSSAAHTIRIVCQGTAGRPAIDVDALLVLH